MKITNWKTITVLVTLILMTTLALTGCGSKGVAVDKQEVAAGKNAPPDSEKTPSDTTVKEGLAKLLKNAQLLREAAIAGDEGKVKTYAPKLEEEWSKIEDGIKPKYPESYDQIEKSLNPIVAGAKVSSFDKNAILKLDEQLIQVLDELTQKLSPK